MALYSHDTVGIGHIRRNLLIAHALVRSFRGAPILLIAGAREAGAFALPQGVDCLTLPSLAKNDGGDYETRRLAIRLEALINLRAQTLAAALQAFTPDVLIVDKAPRGALRELEPALEALRSGGRTRCVLGLRDVLDEPAAVRREWHELANEEAIRCYYDAVWVYGDPVLFDPVTEYGFSRDVAAKVQYTGYLDQRERLTIRTCASVDLPDGLGLPPGRLVLGMVGGGQDGADLADAFSQAQFPPETNAVLLAGPFLPAKTRALLHERQCQRQRFRVLDFLAEPDLLLQGADAVIAMGGYNTVGEILSFEKPALLVPRVRPRREQLIRAQRLSDLGLVDMLHPDELSPAALSEWLSRAPRPRPCARECLDFNGLNRLPHLLQQVLQRPARSVSGAYKHEIARS
jgi:predicted glycosyltransferase